MSDLSQKFYAAVHYAKCVSTFSDTNTAVFLFSQELNANYELHQHLRKLSRINKTEHAAHSYNAEQG